MPKRKTTEYNPLDCIPGAALIEKRLQVAELEARRLRVLLSTAKAIESEPVPPQREAAHHE